MHKTPEVTRLEERADENADTARKRSDPAVRLIVHQLAFLCGVQEIEDSLTVYGELTKACEAQS
jgi:hypothetical protein